MDLLREKKDGGGNYAPAICVPVAGTSVAEIVREAQAAAAEQPDLLEWRADFFSAIMDPVQAEKALKALREAAGALPILFTLRTASEGGQVAPTAAQYAAVLDWAMQQAEIGLLDIEGLRPEFDPRESIAAAFREGKTTIASAHFFDRAPGEEEMTDILARLEATGAEILKLAIMAKEEGDALSLMRVTRDYGERSRCRLITMAMGEKGVITRTTGALTGSIMTFGTVTKSTAPGQLSVRELKQLLHRQ